MIVPRWGRLARLLLAAAMMVGATSAIAGGSSLAAYEGTDRLERLTEAAKREGEVTI